MSNPSAPTRIVVVHYEDDAQIAVYADQPIAVLHVTVPSRINLRDYSDAVAELAIPPDTFPVVWHFDSATVSPEWLNNTWQQLSDR